MLSIFQSYTNNFQTCIWPIDETLTDTTTQDQSGFGSYSNDSDSALPRTPEIEPHQVAGYIK